MSQVQRISVRSRRVAGFALLVAGLVAGCASTPPAVTTTQDPKVDIGAFATFGWRATDANGQPVSIVDSEIRAAITAGLERKGYQQAAAGATPDMLLQYETGKAEVTKGSPFSIGIGVGSYGSSGGVGVGTSSGGTRNVTEGMLILSVVDTARNAEVWNGRVSRELGKNGAPNSALVRQAVDDLLRDFPAHDGRSQ